jgi:peptidyl-dipeptidase Dcp
MKLWMCAIAIAFSSPVLAQAPPVRVNPLLSRSALPLQAPPFDRIIDADFQPAIEEGMKQQLAEIASIANDPASPTFANTIEAMERSGALLRRVMPIFDGLTESNTNPVLQKIDGEEAPKLASHNDEIYLNAKLFARIQTIYKRRATLKLDPEAAHLVERYFQDFVRAGALLSDADKATLRALNREESTLETDYRNKRLAGVNAAAVVVDERSQLDGLSDADIAAAADAAKARGLTGKWVLTLQNTTQQPALANLKNRALRKRLHDASSARGSGTGPTSTEATIARLAQLRAQKAHLLGFPTFAAYALADQMAKTPDAALKLMNDIVPAATARARGEAARMQKLIDEEHGGFMLAPWDWQFYAERVRKADYDIDESEVRPYFELNRVLTDGVFFAATRLYGVTFHERHDLPVYHPDVRVWEVKDADGTTIGLFYGDFFARSNKAGGGWTSSYVGQSKLLGTKNVVTNNTNFIRPAAGQPALLTSDNVTTMFHEFGHALHSLFSMVRYPRSNGIVRDFTEFPSQLNEHWAFDPVVFANYAKHYKTGAPMPQALIDKIKKTKTFDQGFATTENVAASLIDLAWHVLPADAPLQNVGPFEADALKRFHVDVPQVPPRYHSPYFSHIWNNGYSARYYSYLWTEVLDDDAYDWFMEHGGMTRQNGDRYRQMILAKRGQQDFAEMYRAFRGRDPIVGPLLRERGLDGPSAAKNTKTN